MVVTHVLAEKLLFVAKDFSLTDLAHLETGPLKTAINGSAAPWELGLTGHGYDMGWTPRPSVVAFC